MINKPGLNKEAAKNKQKKWKSFTLEDYQNQAKNLTTHTTKSVNSNASNGGVRCISKNNINIPYACVKFSREQIELDYTNGANQSAISEQILAVKNNNLDSFTDIIEEECTQIKEYIVPLLEKNYDKNYSSVSPRLRQIILNDKKFGDICLTPIHSSGYSKRINQLIGKSLDEIAAPLVSGSKEYAFFDDVAVKVGGDKQQNVGRFSLVIEMQKAYRFPIPRTDRNLNTAMYLHNQGVSLAIPKQILENYGKFLKFLHYQDNKKSNEEMKRTDERLEKEYKIISHIINVILNRGDKAYKKISPYVGTVFETIACVELPLIQQGILDHNLRNSLEWKLEFAKELSYKIAQSEYSDNTLIVGISFNKSESLQKHILEIIQ